MPLPWEPTRKVNMCSYYTCEETAQRGPVTGQGAWPGGSLAASPQAKASVRSLFIRACWLGPSLSQMWPKFRAGLGAGLWLESLKLKVSVPVWRTHILQRLTGCSCCSSCRSTPAASIQEPLPRVLLFLVSSFMCIRGIQHLRYTATSNRDFRALLPGRHILDGQA